MSGYLVTPADADLHVSAAIYGSVGFRSDLVDDLASTQRLGGTVLVATAADASPVGSSAALPFGATGWVGGVAVLPEHRGRGLGRMLTGAAIEQLRAGGAETVFLHATPMAEGLYGAMGFIEEGSFEEWSGAVQRASPARSDVRAARPEDLDAALALDREVTGENRAALIRSLWGTPASVMHQGGLRGFHLPQTRSAVGAVLAVDDEAGRALLSAALVGAPGSMRVPAPVEQNTTGELLRGWGFSRHLRTKRMRLGPAVEFHPEHVFSAFNLFWG